MQRPFAICNAAAGGHLDIVRFLSDRDPTCLTASSKVHMFLTYVMLAQNGMRPIHIAAASGSMDIFCFIADRVPEQLSCGDESGQCPIHVAAKQGHLPIVREIARRAPEQLFAVLFKVSVIDWRLNVIERACCYSQIS